MTEFSLSEGCGFHCSVSFTDRVFIGQVFLKSAFELRIAGELALSPSFELTDILGHRVFEGEVIVVYLDFFVISVQVLLTRVVRGRSLTGDADLVHRDQVVFFEHVLVFTFVLLFIEEHLWGWYIELLFCSFAFNAYKTLFQLCILDFYLSANLSRCEIATVSLADVWWLMVLRGLFLELDLISFDLFYSAFLSSRTMRNCIPIGIFMIWGRGLLNFVPYRFDLTKLPQLSLLMLMYPYFQSLNGRDCHRLVDILGGGDAQRLLNHWKRILLWSNFQFGHAYLTGVPLLVILFTAEFFIS